MTPLGVPKKINLNPIQKSPLQLKTKNWNCDKKVISVEMVLNKERWEGRDKGERLLITHEYSFPHPKNKVFYKSCLWTTWWCWIKGWDHELVAND